jgi:8-oxo-dGTP pyrophosphatase MutT (NUDIX family)
MYCIDRLKPQREAAVRELWKETGLEIEQSSLIPFFLSSISPVNQYDIAFRAHLADLLEPTCGAEVCDPAWFGRDEIPAGNYWLPALTSMSPMCTIVLNQIIANCILPM